MNLTARQLETLDFIKSYIERNRIAPSFEEIADHLGLKSKSGVHRIIAALEQRGRILKIPSCARAIKVLE